MTTADALQEGRGAFRRHHWGEAYARLAAADHIAPLGRDDQELLATAAYLCGADEISTEAWLRAYNEYLRAQNVPRAARCAFWMILELLSSGEWARASGWLATAQRLLDEGHHDCPERGLLLVLAARAALKAQDDSAALALSTEATALGDRFNDPELKVFGRLGQGLAHARRGDAAAAVLLFDEAMVAVTTSDVSPIAVGVVYCAVIEACYEILDLGRAREWTAALAQWCGFQPDLVPFRGHCLVHRAETMRLGGAWSNAIEEAEHACRLVSHLAGADASAGTGQRSLRGYPVGAAFYELAEICRMRGRFAEAQEAYRQASRYGRSPEPGLALLHMAEGHVTVAATAIRRELDQPHKRLARADLLTACVEVMLAARDLATARTAVEELTAMTGDLPAPYLRAVSAQARGTLLLAENKPQAALHALRTAWIEWQALEVPYEAARVRVMMGLACRQLGDAVAAELEFDGARGVFLRLDAAPDVARLNGLLSSSLTPSSRLTTRELQVIRLIADGKTNREIAHQLAISERTVDRHVSNILAKLDLPSRSAATAYAYQHNLV